MSSGTPDSGPEVAGKSLAMMTLATGLLLIALGLLGVGVYAYGVMRVIAQGSADRSWIFWGLSLAVIGATLLVSGIVLFVTWRRMETETGEGRSKGSRG